jgi:hypothetical protein
VGLNQEIEIKYLEGNETADKLVKEAAHEDDNINTVFGRIPITSVASEMNRKGLELWQLQRNDAAKRAV